MVEHVEEFGGGLVDGTDDGATPRGQVLQQGDTLETRRAVQATGWWNRD